MTNQHAFCAPSDWEGWSNCPAKPALSENEPDVSSPDAEFGTQAHEWAATLLRSHAVELPDAVPAAMREGLKHYIDAVQECCESYRLLGAKVQLLVEQRLDISTITAERGAKGTADVLIIAEFQDHSVLEVWDLKFGMGVVVSPVENGQEMIYALAAYLIHSVLHNFTEVHLVIHQPRLTAEPKRWSTTPDRLLLFGQRVTEAAALALSLRGDVAALSHLKAGSHCRKTFCRVIYRCPEYKRFVDATVLEELAGAAEAKAVPAMLEQKTLALTPQALAAHLSAAFTAVPIIEAWCLAIRSAVDRELLAGRAIPGFKLVMGRKGARAFTDPDAAALLLLGQGVAREKIYAKPALLSPTQLEKVLQDSPVWSALQELIRQTDGKPSAVPDNDPRAPWSVGAVTDFESHDGRDLV